MVGPRISERRRSRTAVLGAAITLLTVAGHSAASQRLPDVFAIAMVAIVATAISAVASNRRLRVPALAALLLAGQGLGHLLMAAAGPHEVSTHVVAAQSHGLVPSGSMVCFHLAAAVVAAVLLAHADQLAARWSGFLALLRRRHPAMPVMRVASGPTAPRIPVTCAAIARCGAPLPGRAPPADCSAVR